MSSGPRTVVNPRNAAAPGALYRVSGGLASSVGLIKERLWCINFRHVAVGSCGSWDC
jgi:hypothetical protein